MKNIAIIINDEIVNVIVADSAKIAKQVTGAGEVLELPDIDYESLEESVDVAIPWIGWRRVYGVWEPPQE